MTSRIIVSRDKSRRQNKDAEKEFHNHPARTGRSEEEALYASRSRQDLLRRAAQFASELMEKEGLSSISVLEVGSDGIFCRALKELAPSTRTWLAVGDIAIMQLTSIEAFCSKINLDLEYLRFRDKSFDFVFLNGVLHHFPDLSICSKELVRVSRRSIIAVNEPCGTNPLVVFSGSTSRLLGQFMAVNTTVNETIHPMRVYRIHFYGHGAKSVIIENGDEVFTDDRCWVSYLSLVRRSPKVFLRSLLLLRAYLQRVLSYSFQNILLVGTAISFM